MKRHTAASGGGEQKENTKKSKSNAASGVIRGGGNACVCVRVGEVRYQQARAASLLVCNMSVYTHTQTDTRTQSTKCVLLHF